MIITSSLKSSIVLYILTLSFSLIGNMEPQKFSEPPQWFTDHMEYLTQETGIWIANNSVYKSDAEPFDAYGIKWEWGFNKKSIKGKLYGIQDGKDIGSFWEFHSFWHPGENRVVANQFGSDGSFGTGTMQSDELLQTFYNLDGSTYRSGHKSENKENEQRSQSFTVDEQGNWTPRRTYIWKLQSNQD